ncbi:MAG TPA: IclR family transcriptional regulator C-terminal domain-containing protein [Burkholderiales bacterium]|jgi:IclR family mhp operon transcriptional activator|nr:IclR family transcriptional regulator C-terminal domain-containing protein [Burkholderiales bacterium]
MRTRTRTTRRSTKGVRRTLEVLRALNVANGSTVVELHALTSISRPALYRLLEEFQAAGYIRRDARGGFHLTHLVRCLSDGFRNEDRIAEVATPVLDDLQRRVLWPADLAVYSNHAMHLRETTRRQSPLVMDRAQIGLRLPMLASAAGLAYVAHCDDGEREALIEALRKSDRPEDQLARDARRVAQLVRQTRADGYGSRYSAAVPGLPDAAETGAIAVPVRQQARVCACLVITFFSKIMTAREAASRYLADLDEAARRMGARLADAPALQD